MATYWKDIAKDWEQIPLEAYKFLFSQAKDRFDEVISESISLTEKSINLTKITVATVTGFIGYNYKNNPNMEWIVLLGFLFLANLICLVILMFPKGVIFKGSPPKEIFCEYLDNNSYIPDEKIAIIYYHELIRYQAKIDTMNTKNSQRQLFYGIAIILTVLSTVLTAGAILGTIFSRHP